MKLIKTLFVAFSIIAVSNYSSLAQQSDLGNWFVYLANQKLNNNWTWANEIQYRSYNFASDFEQLLIRTGIGYNLTDNNNNLLLGLAYIRSEPYINGTDNKLKSNEFRVYQQFINRQTIGRVALQHRYRIEERFLPNNAFRMRFRYFLALNIPLNKKVIEKNTLYLSGYNEIFINEQNPTFDRNRIFTGVGLGVGKNTRIETGVMYQLFETRNRPQWQIIFFNNAALRRR